MAKANGKDLPFLVTGGGIGGLIAAYALASKGFPVRVFEQAPEFKELGAGIQLGPEHLRHRADRAQEQHAGGRLGPTQDRDA